METAARRGWCLMTVYRRSAVASGGLAVVNKAVHEAAVAHTAEVLRAEVEAGHPSGHKTKWALASLCHGEEVEFHVHAYTVPRTTIKRLKGRQLSVTQFPGH